jgi:DNA-binding response OmpR family regulator
VTQVLVVDDDDDIRLLVAELLRLTGYEVLPAASGVEALAVLAAGVRPDLVLLDVQMPELDGWDTLRCIRNDVDLHHLPVVLCTVKSGPVDTALGWTLGCDGYVVKPFAIDALVGEVEAVLARTADEREAHRAKAAIVLREVSR